MKMDKSQYKDVYVFVEQREGVIQKVAIELLGKARELADSLNEKVVAMLLGYEVAGQAQELIAYGAESYCVLTNGSWYNIIPSLTLRRLHRLYMSVNPVSY